LNIKAFSAGDADTEYFSNLLLLHKRVTEISKQLEGDKAEHSTKNDKDIEAFSKQLDQIYKGTVIKQSFGQEFIDLNSFTTAKNIEVYSTSIEKWKSNYLQNLKEQIRNKDEFKKLEFYEPGQNLPVAISSEDNGIIGSPKYFPWVGGGFEFNDVTKKLMENEVSANKLKAERFLQSHSKPTKKLAPITKDKIQLPYNISYDERKKPGSDTESVYTIRAVGDDPLSIFKNLVSNMYVDESGYNSNPPQPIRQVENELLDYDILSEYLSELGSIKETPKRKELHDQIFSKQIDIKGKFLSKTIKE
jgi:hypothetical protein